MTQEEIRAIALEVAKEMGFRCVEDYILFATRFLAAITEKAEPVGEVDSFGRVILKYSPMHGTKLFTNPAIEPAQQEPLGVTEGTATPAGAAPLPDEVAQMVERLRIRTGSRMVAEQLCIEAAEMIERLARQVPEGCVVVQRTVTEDAKCVMATPGNYRTYQDQWAALIAAGEVKP